jgi:PAS domain S-box-containing protein
MGDEKKIMAAFRGDDTAAATPEVLPDRRELALVALERTRMPMVITDARKEDFPIVLANKAFLELTGYCADEIIGRNCRFLQGADTQVGDIASIRRGLEAHEHVDVELLNYRKDGTSFWNQLLISPIFDDGGVLLYHFASQKDVSVRRHAQESEAAERLLLMEVDHRAMNALALVQSLVRLTRADDVESYAASVQQRVDALARAHRLLGQNGWKSAGLADLVSLELPAAFLSRIAVAGPTIALAPQIVQPVTLALHELMANAVTHGALTQSAGSIDIRWQDLDGRIHLQWRESGRPGLEAKQSEGFGLSLIRTVVERQLGGTIELSWDRDGLNASMLFAPYGARGVDAPSVTGRFRSASA